MHSLSNFHFCFGSQPNTNVRASDHLNIFEYQVNIEDPVVIVALKVIRVLLIYSECFKYSKTSGMKGEKKVN